MHLAGKTQYGKCFVLFVRFCNYGCIQLTGIFKFQCDNFFHFICIGNIYIFFSGKRVILKVSNNRYILLYFVLFVVFLQIGTNIPDLLEQTNMEQPFILILGESIVRPEQAFVIVERQAMPQASLLKAVDVCFKLFYVLDIAFPWQSLSTWDFFKKWCMAWERGRGGTLHLVVSALSELF